MKKYGQADLMMHLAKEFIKNSKNLTPEQKEKILQECRKKILENYPTAREWEFTA